MKKVLGISCGRRNGNSEILMKEAMMAIQERCEAECSYIRLMDAEVKACVGCETCVKRKLTGDDNFRCITPVDADHVYLIEQACREADAIIFAAPIYNILPPGILIKLLNKLHACGDYRTFVAQNPKVGATIAVGGSDWLEYAGPILNMTCQEYVGGFHRVVDSLVQGFTPALQGVLADDECLERARLLGLHVADALNTGDTSWKGAPGVCPCCHGTMLDFRGDRFVCPMCDIVLDADRMPTRFSVSQDAVEHNRWGLWGMKRHIDIVKRGHMRAVDGQGQIAARRGKYMEYLKPMELPKIGK